MFFFLVKRTVDCFSVMCCVPLSVFLVGRSMALLSVSRLLPTPLCPERGPEKFEPLFYVLKSPVMPAPALRESLLVSTFELSTRDSFPIIPEERQFQIGG